MPTATRYISRIADCDDYASALSWAGGVVFNEAGADVDFRVEGVGQANALVVQGSDGNVGIGTAAPEKSLHVVGGDILLDNNMTYMADDAGGTPRGLLRLSGGDDVVLGTSSIDDVLFQVGTLGTAVAIKDGTGYVGIGTTSPDRLCHIEVSDAETAAVTYGLRLSHITSGTAAANFGTGIEFELEDDGGGMNVAGQIYSYWVAATAGSERGGMVFTMRKADGTNGVAFKAVANAAGTVSTGFFGSVQAQQNHIIDADGQLADITTKFNTLLADLEGYGLLASA